MIPFTNLCSYRLVFSKNLMKIGGLRAPFFLPTIIGTGKGANSKVAQKLVRENTQNRFTIIYANAKTLGKKKPEMNRAKFGLSYLIHTLNTSLSFLINSSTPSASSWRMHISSSIFCLSCHSLSNSISKVLTCSLPFHLLP